MIRKYCAAVIGLALVGLAGTAASQNMDMGSAGDVRVACDVGAAGALANCEIISRRTADRAVDRTALLAAEQSVAWIGRGVDHPTGRIHFPVRFASEADYERMIAGPPGPPVVVPPPTMEPAVSPVPPADETIRAWGGLDCVLTAELGLRKCWADGRSAPPGVLGGIVRRVMMAETVAGRIPGLPDRLPASPSEVREIWTPRGDGPGGALFSRDYAAPTSQGRVMWVASLLSSNRQPASYAGTYELREYDCAGGRLRWLLRASANGTGLISWSSTEPSDWYDRDDLGGPVLLLFDELCAA